MNKIIRSKKPLILLAIAILLLSNIVMAAGTAVNVVTPEIKDVNNIKVVNSKVEPYQDVNVSSTTGGIIEKVDVVIGQYVTKGQSLIEFEQDNIKIQVEQAEAALQIAKTNHQKLLKGATDEQIKSAEAGVKQAGAALKIAKANYKMMKDGAVEEDIESVKAQYQQAVSSYEGAKSNLKLLESIYNDRTMQKQQLVGSETQVKSAEKQVEVAEERLQQAKISLEQARNGLQQAKNEYERIKYLYEENVVTREQYEMVENQYQNVQSTVENAQSAVESARIAKEQADVSYQGALENYNLTEETYNNPTQLEQQLAAAKTQLEVSEANMKMAKANLDKVEKGARVEELATGAANVEQAEAALEGARTQLEQVKKGATEEDIKISEANIKRAEAALKQAKKALQDTIVKSPINGIVAQSNFEAGEMAGPGTPLINLVNLDKVFIKADVTADVLVGINEGNQVQAKVLAYPDQEISGKIEYISPVVDQRTQAFTVKVLVENPGRKIKGGMFVDLYFSINKSSNSLVIPTDALLDLEGNPYVYVVNNGKAERRDLKLGISNDQEVSVLEGINRSDRVIIRGQKSISSGDTVEVIG